MSSYIEDALTQGETVVHTARISAWVLSGPILLGLVLLPAFGVGLLFWLYAYIQYKATELAITNKRVLVKHGFIARQTIELSISKVESIRVDQTVMGRVLNYGSLVISGAGTAQEPVRGIAKPMAFRKAFISAQDGVAAA